MPALSSVQPTSTRRIVCPQPTVDSSDSLLDNNNDQTVVDHNLPQPITPPIDTKKDLFRSPSRRPTNEPLPVHQSPTPPPSPPRPFESSDGFKYVFEEETPEPAVRTKVKGSTDTGNQYRSVKLPGNQQVIMSNNFLYLDPSAFSIVWINVGLFIVLHSFYFYSFYAVYAERKCFSLIVGKCFFRFRFI
jgi:hypothetical protein